MKIREIVKRIYDLRKTRKPFVSNYYLSLQKSDKDFVTWTTDSSIVFCDQEENLLRCYFASVDLQDLNTLFEKVPSDAVMDYIVKEELSEFSWVNDTLFRHYTTLARHTYLDLCGEHEKSKHELFMEQFYEENFGEFATEKDAEELYQMLYQIFDFRVSRLPSMEELLELDEGTLKVEDSLEDIDEWDSMSKLYLVTYVKKEMQKRLTVDEIKNFETVQDICDYLD